MNDLILLLAVSLVIFGARRLTEIARELGEGPSRFRKWFDQAAHDAGQSLGGIFGKPAAEALTPENQNAELYDPAVFQDEEGSGRAAKRMWFRCWRFWHSVLKRLKHDLA